MHNTCASAETIIMSGVYVWLEYFESKQNNDIKIQTSQMTHCKEFLEPLKMSH